MVALLDLWLPIALSAVLVFVASSVIHMATPLHKGDLRKLPDEARAMDALRPLGIPPGTYMFPCPGSMKEMGSPEFTEKLSRGPVGLLTVRPSGPVQMGRNLAQWFLFSLFVSAACAYVAGQALAPGAETAAVVRFTGVRVAVARRAGGLKPARGPVARRT